MDGSSYKGFFIIIVLTKQRIPENIFAIFEQASDFDISGLQVRSNLRPCNSASFSFLNNIAGYLTSSVLCRCVPRQSTRICSDIINSKVPDGSWHVKDFEINCQSAFASVVRQSK